MADLDRDIISLAGYYRVAATQVRALLCMQAMPMTSPERWRQAAVLRRALGSRFAALNAAVTELAARVAAPGEAWERRKRCRKHHGNLSLEPCG